jgi:hypothetical protein
MLNIKTGQDLLDQLEYWKENYPNSLEKPVYIYTKDGDRTGIEHLDLLNEQIDINMGDALEED